MDAYAQRGHPLSSASFSRPLRHFALQLAPIPPRMPHTIDIRVRGRSTATRIAKSPEEFSRPPRRQRITAAIADR
jgi:hypothetical protein